MENCDKTRDLLVLYSEGVLDAAQAREIDEHIESCSACRKEAEAFAKIRGWLSDPELFVPSQDYRWQMLPRTLVAKARSLGQSRRWLPPNFGSRSWALSLALAMVLCFGLVWMTHRHSSDELQMRSQAAAPGNEAFLNRMQIAYARGATVEYLSACQDLLLNVMRAEKNCQGDLYDVSAEITQARQLLQQKQMLEAELKSPRVAQAKDLCDELERLLVDLSTSDRCESHDKIRSLERYIQREKLLLRINVLQSELS